MIPLHIRAGWRHLTRHRWLTALSVLGIALGVGVVVAVDLASTSARLALKTSMAAVVGEATHQILAGPDGLPETVYRDLRLGGWETPLAPIIEATVSVANRPGHSFRLLGVDGTAEFALGRGQMGATGAGLATGDGLLGALRGVTQPAQAWVSGRAAAALGLAPGDPLELLLPLGRGTVTVAGVLDDAGTERDLSGLMLMDIAAAQELLAMDGRISRIDVRLPEGRAGEQALAALQARLPTGLRVETTGSRVRAMEGMTRAFEFNLMAMSLLALVVGLYLIYNTLSFAVVQRRPLLGILRTVGVTRGQVFRAILGEALLLGLAGTLLGLLLGTALAQFLVGLVGRTINDIYYTLQISQLALSPWGLTKGLLLGLAGSALAALPAAWEAARTPPRRVLNRSDLEARTRRLVPRLAALGLFLAVVVLPLLLLWPSRSLLPVYAGLIALVLAASLVIPALTVGLMGLVAHLAPAGRGLLLRMAARGVVRSLSRTGLAIAALTVALSTAVGVGTMIYSFRGSVTDWLERTLSAQIYVSPGGGAPRGARLPDSLLPTLAALPGMAEVVGIRAAPIDTPDGPVGVSAAPFTEQLRGALQFLAGDPATAYAALTNAQRKTPAVLASEPLAWHRQLKVGDRLQLATDAGWRAFEVVGIYQDFASDQGHLLMDEATFGRHWNRPGVTGIGLYLAPDADEAALVTQIQALATPEMPLSVMRTAGILAFSLQIFDRTFAVTGVLRLLTLIVSLAGVTSALMALQLERTRECAVLRALGMTPGQVRRWVTLQTALMGMVAGLLAVPVGLVLAAVLTGAVNQRAFGWTIDFQIAPGLLLQALGLAVLAALVAGAYPAWRMGRTPPALALREE